MPKRKKSSYRSIAKASIASRLDLSNKSIEDIHTFVDLDGERIQVDTVMAWCRRNKISDSSSRLIYNEIELLVEQGVIPRQAYAGVGNRRYFATDFLKRVAGQMDRDLQQRIATKTTGTNDEVKKIANQLAKNPELTKLIAELLAEATEKA